MNKELGQHWRTRLVVVAFLAAAQVAFAVACTQFGIPDGPRWAMLALEGAILVHPFVLYPMWAALSRDGLAWRIPLASLLSVTVVYVDFGDCNFETAAVRATLELVAFVLVAAGFWLVRRASGWQIVPIDATPTSRVDRPFRFQYRLRHLLEGMLLTACVLAAFRVFFPQGITFPQGIIGGWNRIGWEVSDSAMALALLLPPAVVPWAVLIRHDRRKWALLLAVIGWLALDYGLFQILAWSRLPRGVPSPSKLRDVFLFVQSGASVAGLLSALVFRWLGYRIARAEPKKEAATGE